MFYMALTSSTDTALVADLYRGKAYLISIDSDKGEECQSVNMVATQCVAGECLQNVHVHVSSNFFGFTELFTVTFRRKGSSAEARFRSKLGHW